MSTWDLLCLYMNVRNSLSLIFVKKWNCNFDWYCVESRDTGRGGLNRNDLYRLMWFTTGSRIDVNTVLIDEILEKNVNTQD